MSAQDKMERILKEVHLLISDGTPVPENPEQVIIEKKKIFAILEKLNLAVYEIMDQYEVTSQSRELAQRRSEKKGEELLEKISAQAEDVYAASLIYTNDALNHVQDLMEKAIADARGIWHNLNLELEKEKSQVRKDQAELREQLQDFKDSNKYLVMIEDCNREREKVEKEKEGGTPEKRIQNEAKHYSMKGAPEIKVNAAYFKRRGLEMAEEAETEDLEMSKAAAETEDLEMPKAMAELEDLETFKATADGELVEISLESEVKPVRAEIRVDLDSEYFKWKAQEKSSGEIAADPGDKPGKKERKGLWGKK